MDEHHDWQQARNVARAAARSTAALALITAAYYALPLDPKARFRVDFGGVVSVGVVLLGLVGFVLVFIRQIRRVSLQRPAASIEGLLTTLYLLIFFFASVYYALGRSGDQFIGIETKTDALYFTATVIATVGFGDVVASGQTARLIVTIQMLFNLIYLGAAVRLLGRIGARPPPVDGHSSTQGV